MSDFPPLVAAHEDELGTVPSVSETLEVQEKTKFAVNTPAQALAIVNKLIEDWKPGIKNQATITAQLNGQRPRSKAALKQHGRDWYPNVNMGTLRIESSKVPARLWMPIMTAASLTAAALPPGAPQGLQKTFRWRTRITKTIRTWRKWPWFMRSIAREAGIFGFGFAVWMDEWEWRPTFVRQDRGFVPKGCEILDEHIPVFAVLMDYQPHELLDIVRKADGTGVSGWNKAAVAKAITHAGPKNRSGDEQSARSFEEMARQSSLGNTYEKAYQLVKTVHLWSVDADGSVSHHVQLADGDSGKKTLRSFEGTSAADFLFEARNQYQSMSEVVLPMFFDPDDGTIQGAWGAGQYLFDKALEADKAANDWVAAAKQAAKLKTQLAEGKNAAEAKLHIDDAMTLLEGATYAGNQAAVVSDPAPFMAIQEFISQKARETIGSFIPPIPLQPSDIKAAQINAKAAEQQDVREQFFQTWLLQFAALVEEMSRRLVKKDSPEDIPKKTREAFKNEDGLSDKEIEQFLDQNPIQTIYEFTEQAAQRRAAFAASKAGNPFYNQKSLERTQAVAAGGVAFADEILVPGDDEAVAREAQRRQDSETATMLTLMKVVDVLPIDLDWPHMQALRPVIERSIQTANFEVAEVLLQHYAAHFTGGVAKQGLPKDRINAEKSFIAKAQKAIQTLVPPEEGFEDQIDLVEQAQTRMAMRQATSADPSLEPETMSRTPETAEVTS